MATTYRITYRVLPAGVGPDDYEPKDLEKRVELVELSDPEPAGMVAGKMLYYGPKDTEIREALKDRIPEGAYPIVLDCRRPDAED